MVSLINRYIGRNSLLILIAVQLSVCVVIISVDYIEIIRRYYGNTNFTYSDGLLLAVYRSVFFVDLVLPFVVLITMIICLVRLSTTSELIVARASGISIWGILFVPAVIIFIVGVCSVVFINPLASRLGHMAAILESTVFDSRKHVRSGNVWLRQAGSGGESIISGKSYVEGKNTLFGAMAIVFDEQGQFKEKIQSRIARYKDGFWIMPKARIISENGPPKTVKRYRLPTDHSASDISQTLLRAENLSVFTLPKFIKIAEASGLKSEPFKFAFHNLLARPFFLVAMVLISATVSLRISRSGAGRRLIGMGVLAGFLLYFLTEIMRDLGGNGIIDHVVAAWSPSIIALTIGATGLLYLEDG